MLKMPLCAITVLLCLMGCFATLANAQGNLPLPEMVVAKTPTPPTIDGKIMPGEWDYAPAATGFVKAFAGDLAKIQSMAQFTYDDKYIYVCLKNYRASNITLLSKRGRKNDDVAIVFDQSNEIWITPPVTPATTYQTLFNAYPGVFDVKMIPSVGYTAKSWTGHWEFASTETKDSWIVEAKAPITSFGVSKIPDGAKWQALFTTDNFADGDAFRAWAPGGAFADIPRHGFMVLKENTAVFQLYNIESIFTGKPEIPIGVTGPAKGKSEVTATLRFGPGIEPSADDYLLTKTVTVENGKHTDVTLSGDLSDVRLTAGKDGKTGYCEVTAKDADGVLLYHQIFPIVVNGFVRVPPAEIKKTPYVKAFGLDAFYAPFNKKLIVKIDRLYMDRRSDAVTGIAKLLDPKTGAVVAERPIASFAADYSEFPMDLSKLPVPVQTEDDWANAQPVVDENTKIADENKKLKAAGQPELPLKAVPGPQPAEYTLQVTLTTKDGQALATTDIATKLMGYKFAWQDNTVGISDKVIPPWTPLDWKNGTLSMWNKSYRLNGLGLAEKITNAGAPQLSGPMKLVATIDGKETEIKAGQPAMVKLTEANADLSGSAKLGSLNFNVKTRVEFDGFVLNTMTIDPQAAAKLDRLSLIITMPKAEAPCFVTTAGGWSATHGWTPQKWDSRETSSGCITGNFVPYIFLTDSDRGFCWFADNEKGWILDPTAPTQELSNTATTTTLRINFVTKPGAITQPTTIKYGWMVTPQKPQLKEWRSYVINYYLPYPKAHAVFWRDADWAVTWPYYSSPYPWDYAKSKALLANNNSNFTPCVGDIAHAIGRYRDYKGRWFNDVAADWGITLGDTGDGNVARSQGPNDFQVWHFDRWVKQSGLSGLYFDENYLGEEYNYLTGGAYLLPDEQIQPGYSYLGLREYDKRLRYMFNDNGKTPPYLWLHTTSGHPVYAWMPDVAMEGENVEPTGKYDDYMDGQNAGRLRSIGMGTNLGSVPTIMCQSDNHWNPTYSPFLVHQFVGWLLAHDCLPATVQFWTALAPELELWRDETRFLPYWKEGLGVKSLTKDVVASAHVWPGHAVLWIANTAHEDCTATVALDMAKLGFDAKKTLVFDTETGERYTITGGKLTLALPQRMWRSVRLVQPKLLTGDQTFVAHFETDAIADEALGNRYPAAATMAQVPQADAAGKTGKGLTLNQALIYATRQLVTRERGAVEFQLYCDSAKTNGALLAIGNLSVQLNRTKVAVSLANKKLGEADLKTQAVPAWHAFAISWQDKALKVTVDGTEALAITLDAPLPINPMARGLEIADYHSRVTPTSLSIGPVKDAVIDDLIMRK